MHFLSNTFISNARLKLARIQANAKQHPEADCHLKIIHILHPRYHPKMVGQVLKNKKKDKCVCIHKITRLILMKLKINMKNRSHRSRYELK